MLPNCMRGDNLPDYLKAKYRHPQPHFHQENGVVCCISVEMADQYGIGYQVNDQGVAWTSRSTPTPACCIQWVARNYMTGRGRLEKYFLGEIMALFRNVIDVVRTMDNERCTAEEAQNILENSKPLMRQCTVCLTDKPFRRPVKNVRSSDMPLLWCRYCSCS